MIHVGSGTSGLYIGTYGSGQTSISDSLKGVGAFAKALGVDSNENTATVWRHIIATQGNYRGTYLPRSFVVDTPSGSFWTHGNGTKHMYESIKKAMETPSFKGANHGLLTQFILYDFRESISAAAASGRILYGRKIQTGHWELIFSKTESDKYPVIKHAMFRGL